MDAGNRNRLAMLGVLAAVLVALAIVAPEIYTGTFSDTGTFLRVMAVIVALTLVAAAARRFIPNRSAATAVAVVPAVVALALFVWPYLRPATEVDEAFPAVATAMEGAAATSSPATTPSPVTTTTTAVVAQTAPPPQAATRPPSGTNPPTALAPPAAPPTTVPPTTVPSTRAPSTRAPPTTVPSTRVPSTTVPPTTAPPATEPAQTEPIELARSGFQGLTGHRGSGDAALYRLVDQSIVLRFEDVDIGSGPDLDVYVVQGGDRRDLTGAVYVAPLTAERGNQNYTLPAGVDVTTGTWTVLVWCETFDVEVANATLDG